MGMESESAYLTRNFWAMVRAALNSFEPSSNLSTFGGSWAKETYSQIGSKFSLSVCNLQISALKPSLA